MRTYQAEQIRLFLTKLDGHLRVRVRLVIIGGGAALLQHGARSPTRDIDTFEGDPSALREAAALAEAEIGFAVPMARAGVADLPLHYEDRCERPLPQLTHLDVLVPDRYDLVLSKLVRASQADLVVCKEIHEHKALNVTALVRRYVEEMNHAIGRHADRDQNLIAAVEFMWDAATADHAERLIERSRASGLPVVERRDKPRRRSPRQK